MAPVPRVRFFWPGEAPSAPPITRRPVEALRRRSRRGSPGSSSPTAARPPANARLNRRTGENRRNFRGALEACYMWACEASPVSTRRCRRGDQRSDRAARSRPGAHRQPDADPEYSRPADSNAAGRPGREAWRPAAVGYSWGPVPPSDRPGFAVRAAGPGAVDGDTISRHYRAVQRQHLLEQCEQAV